jgi:hypothetical protein
MKIMIQSKKQIKVNSIVILNKHFEKLIDLINSIEFSTLNEKSYNLIPKMYQKVSEY